jgi:hypothetical protein
MPADLSLTASNFLSRRDPERYLADVSIPGQFRFGPVLLASAATAVIVPGRAHADLG